MHFEISKGYQRASREDEKADHLLYEFKMTSSRNTYFINLNSIRHRLGIAFQQPPSIKLHIGIAVTIRANRTEGTGRSLLKKDTETQTERWVTAQEKFWTGGRMILLKLVR